MSEQASDLPTGQPILRVTLRGSPMLAWGGQPRESGAQFRATGTMDYRLIGPVAEEAGFVEHILGSSGLTPGPVFCSTILGGYRILQPPQLHARLGHA